MKNNPDQEAKLSIGCRVTQSQKEILLQESKENGYHSFSQYLEELILSTFEDFERKQQTVSLSENNLEFIISKISQNLDPNNTIYKDDTNLFLLDFRETVNFIHQDIIPKASIGFFNDLNYSTYSKDEIFKELVKYLNNELLTEPNLIFLYNKALKSINK